MRRKAAERRRRSCRDSAGPSSLGGVLRLHQDGVGRVFAAADDAFCETLLTTQLEEISAQQVVVTSSYSGGGSFKYGCAEVLSRSGAHLGKNIDLIVYSTIEVNETANRFLSAHRSPVLAQHSFGDVLDRLSLVEREHVEDISKRTMQLWDDCKAEAKCSNWSGKEFSMERDKSGDRFVADLFRELHQIELLERQYCERCGKLCNIPPYTLYPGALWIEAAGTTCTPWSAMNKSGDRFCSIHTLPMLTWAFSNRYYMLWKVLHECTLRSPPQILEAAFNDAASSQLTSTLAPHRPDDDNGQDCPRGLRTEVFSTAHIGIPSDRERR